MLSASDYQINLLIMPETQTNYFKNDPPRLFYEHPNLLSYKGKRNRQMQERIEDVQLERKLTSRSSQGHVHH